MGSHPYEDVQVKCRSWGHTKPPEVAEESCWNAFSEIVTASRGTNDVIQDAYRKSLVHSSFDGIRVSDCTKNQRPQLSSVKYQRNRGEPRTMIFSASPV